MNLCGWTLKGWHTDSPCRWEELTLADATVQQLARLPLHSLKRPVRWACLRVHERTPLREVRAAVANVTQRCPAGFRWGAVPGCDMPELGFLPGGADVAAVLRALKPLMARHLSLDVRGVRWDVGLVRALGEALPRTCTRLMLSEESVADAVLEHMARSMPWLARVDVRGPNVCTCACCVEGVKGGGSGSGGHGHGHRGGAQG